MSSLCKMKFKNCVFKRNKNRMLKIFQIKQNPLLRKLSCVWYFVKFSCVQIDLSGAVAPKPLLNYTQTPLDILTSYILHKALTNFTSTFFLVCFTSIQFNSNDQLDMLGPVLNYAQVPLAFLIMLLHETSARFTSQPPS